MAAKTALFHGCSRSEIIVTPSNWNTARATTYIAWKITYRFYDPTTKGTKNWGKQIPIYGMNEYKKLEDRQKITQMLIDNEKVLLDEKGYNPITGQFMLHANQVFEIHPDTDFITALREGLKKVSAVPDTKKDMGYVVDGVAIAAKVLYDTQLGMRFNMIPVSKINSSHIFYILEQCQKDNSKFSNNRYNTYKYYLSSIFKVLKQLRAITTNPTRDVDPRKKSKKVPEILTPEELKKIDGLRYTRYYFWRYIRVFFRSGSRTTEMLSLKKEKVSLARQEFIVMVKKGDINREDRRPIANDVLFLWEEIMSEAADGDFLFSKNLQPGPNQIGKSQPLRRWNNYVTPSEKEGGLGINKSFYKLKHTHSDLISEKLSLKHAQVMDGHTTERTTLIYAIGEERRRKEELKNLEIKFAG